VFDWQLLATSQNTQVKVFNGFIYESNKGKQINFVTSLSEAIKVLTDKW